MLILNRLVDDESDEKKKTICLCVSVHQVKGTTLINEINYTMCPKATDASLVPDNTAVISSTGRRPASYCHGVVSVVRPSVRSSVRSSVRACVCKLFL